MSLEQLRQEITKLFNQVNKIQNQMKKPNTQKDVQAQMCEFLPVSQGSKKRIRLVFKIFIIKVVLE